MNNELIERVDREREHLTEMLRITVVGTTLESELIRSLKLAEDCKAALTQRQEAELAGWRVSQENGWMVLDAPDGRCAGYFQLRGSSKEVAIYQFLRDIRNSSNAPVFLGGHPAAQPQVPEGHQLVPVEPTQHMLHEAYDNHMMPLPYSQGTMQALAANIYKTMLSAAKEEQR